MSRTHLLFCAAIIAVACGSPMVAWGGVYDLYGLGSRGTAMAGAQGATVVDYAASYYNPARLTVRKRTHFGLALQLTAPSLHIDRGPDSPGDEQGGRSNELPQNNVGLTTGAVFPIGGLLEERLAVGFSIFLPTLRFTRVEGIDPATPQFVMYQSLPDKLVINPALAVEIVDGLSVGLGMQVLVALKGESDLVLDTPSRRIVRREFRSDIDSAIAPVVGLSYHRHAPWAVGLTYRGALDLRYALPITFDFEEVGLLSIDIDGSSLYTPEQFNLGAAWSPTGWTFAADLTWARWSGAPSPAADFRAVFDDRNLFPDQEPEAIFDFDTPDIDPGYVDVWIPRLGVEYAASDMFMLRGGYAYRPTPVPQQVGYTNYLDANAHQIGLGGSVTFRDPLEVFEDPIRLDLFTQGTLLVERPVLKERSRDTLGIGDYTAGGQIWNVGVEYNVDF